MKQQNYILAAGLIFIKTYYNRFVISSGFKCMFISYAYMVIYIYIYIYNRLRWNVNKNCFGSSRNV